MAPSSRYCWRSTTLLAVSSMPWLRAGEHPQLLTADAGSDTELPYRSHSIQTAMASSSTRRRRRPPPLPPSSRALWVRSATADIRTVSTSQRPRGTHRGHAPGQIGHGDETRRPTTIEDANRVLNDFLPRFNERFRVPPENADTAYRVPDPGMCLDTVLCLKYRRRVGRDNTVKYRWRTLQLLPDKSRPSYAGSVVEVLEGLDGRLAVQHEAAPSPPRAPPRPSVLRSFDTRTVHTAGPSRYTNGVTRRSEDAVASMGTMP